MKVTIFLLLVLGIVAAVCAVMLINALDIANLRASRSNADVTVVKVNQSLPAMTILTEDMLDTETIKLTEAPQGYYTNPAQVVGKVLSLPMVEAQPVTTENLVRGGSSAQLAATLPKGMRAVSIDLTGSQISGGMLYPGCIVDILVAFTLRGNEKGEALSTTMLERVPVLAVQGKSVVSTPEAEGEEKAEPRVNTSSSRGISVTLMLDTKQAEYLQLADLNGDISVTLRNPLDDQPLDEDATVLNRGKLSRLGSLMGVSVKTQPGTTGTGNGSDETDSNNSADLQDSARPSVERVDPINSEVMVIRGPKISYEEVKNEEEEAVAKE